MMKLPAPRIWMIAAAAGLWVALYPATVGAFGIFPAFVGGPNLTATALMLLGLLLLAAEIKIMSNGILGFIGGMLMLAATVIIWRDGRPFWGLPPIAVTLLVVTAFVLLVILAVLAVRAHREKVVTGYGSYEGEIAVVTEPLSPEGVVFFQSAYWQAVSSAPVAEGEKVRIVEAQGLKLKVEPLENQEDTFTPRKLGRDKLHPS